MTIEPRSAARYVFLRELWEGRDRVIADAEVGAVVGLARSLAPSGPASADDEVLNALLGGDGRRVHVLAGGPPPPRSPLLRRGAGPEIVDVDALIAHVDAGGWEVALVDLTGFLGDHASPSRMLRRDLPGLARRLDRRAIGLLDALADGAARGKGVVVSVAAGQCKAAEFQALVEACFERAHLFGVAPVPMIAVVDFGEIARDDDGRGEPPDEVGIAFDNTLGADVPAFTDYVAIVGPRMAGGLTLLEVPGAPDPTLSEALRAELTQARRQLEAASLGRDALGSQLEAAQSRLAALEARPRPTAVRERLREIAPSSAMASAAASTAVSGGAASVAARPAEVRIADAGEGERVDVLRASIQTLRWELEKARAVIGRLRERPVDAMEAEVASLRAQVDRGNSGRTANLGAQAAHEGLVAVVRRLERGGLGGAELRRRLTEVVDLLATAAGPTDAGA